MFSLAERLGITVWEKAEKVEEEGGRIMASPECYDVWTICVLVMNHQLIS